MKLIGYLLFIIFTLGVLVFAYQYQSWSMRDINETLVCGNAILKALEYFKQAESKYPSELSSIVPKFISEIPSPTVGNKKWEYLLEGNGFYLGVNGSDLELDPVLYITNATNEWFMDTK